MSSHNHNNWILILMKSFKITEKISFSWIWKVMFPFCTLHPAKVKMSHFFTTQVMAVAGLDSSRAHCLSPTRSTRSWATPPATPASKDESPYYTPLIRVDRPRRDSISGSHVSVRKSSWYTDDPEFSQRTYSPIHLQVPLEYHNQYHQKRGSATSLVEAVSLKLFQF